MIVTQNLVETKEGIYLVSPHGRLIWEGKKKIIIKSGLYKNEVNKLLYLIEDSKCYGIIRLKYPIKINLSEFRRLTDMHLISEDERRKWWPYKEILYAYRFDVINMFDEPREVKIPQGVQTFVKDFEFLNIEEQLIRDIGTYDPSKVGHKQLADDWRIALAWYATKKSGGKIKHSIEDIINLAGVIYREIIKRVAEGKMKHEFQPEKMKPLPRELYDIVSKNKTGIMSEPKYDLTDPNLLEHFEDKIITKDFISVVGSYVEQQDGHIPNDVDLLIRMSDPTSFLKRAVETRICKDLGFSDKIHFIWGDAEGPHDSFIPLYDLKLSRIKPCKRVKMQEEEFNEETLAKTGPFNPMKPSKRFYQLDEALNYMYKSPQKYALEKKYNGFRGLLVKNGDQISIFSDQKRDISKYFPTVRAQATQLASKNFIVDSEITIQNAGRSQIARYVIGSVPLDDSKITLNCFDLVEFGEDISDKPWHERKQLLHSLNFTKNIKEVHSIIVNDRSDASKAITLLRNLPGSEGAMIKTYDGKYTKNGRTDAWTKFRNEDAIIVRVMKVNQKQNGKTYLMGIQPPKNAYDKYVEDGYLILGDTFVTDIEAAVGDHLEVNIEETWRHTYPKHNNAIRYSIHKPKVMKKSESPLTTWETLDEFAVSKGEEVIENSEQFERTEIKFIGTGAMGSKRKDSSIWLQSGDEAILIGTTPEVKRSDLPRDPDAVFITSNDPEDKSAGERLAEETNAELINGEDWEGKRLTVKHYKVVHTTSSDTYGYVVNDKIAVFPEFWKFPVEPIKNAKIAILDGSGLRDIPFAGEAGGHKSAIDSLEEAKKLGVDKVYFVHIGKQIEADPQKIIEIGGLLPDDGETIEMSATTTTSPGIAEVQGKIFPKRRPIAPKKYYEGKLKSEVLPKIIEDISQEIDDEDRLELCEVFFCANEDEEIKGEGGTRSSAAEKFWQANWQNMYPRDGSGKFVYQHHWRGLSEAEANTMSNEQLLNTDHSVHGDFRGEVSPKELFGFTVFLGTAQSNKEADGDKLVYQSEHKKDPSKLEGAFKLAIPHGWLEVGSGNGTISQPAGVGATSKKYAKFFVLDKGDYDVGVWRAHMFELFMHGDKLKGRAVLQYAPVGEGGRKWLIDFPADQTPYADSHKLDDVIKELKQKKQKWLIWSKPGQKPQKIDVEKYEVKDGTTT